MQLSWIKSISQKCAYSVWSQDGEKKIKMQNLHFLFSICLIFYFLKSFPQEKKY